MARASLPPTDLPVTQLVITKQALGRQWKNYYYFAGDLATPNGGLPVQVAVAEGKLHLPIVQFTDWTLSAGGFKVKFRDPDGPGPKTGRRVEFVSNGKFVSGKFVDFPGELNISGSFIAMFVGFRLTAGGSSGHQSKKEFRPPATTDMFQNGRPSAALLAAINIYRTQMAAIPDINNRGEQLSQWTFDGFCNVGTPDSASAVTF